MCACRSLSRCVSCSFSVVMSCSSSCLVCCCSCAVSFGSTATVGVHKRAINTTGVDGDSIGVSALIDSDTSEPRYMQIERCHRC
ncbi:hypothetical protein BKA93DRAFT_811190 [Sparassis latifolia]